MNILFEDRHLAVVEKPVGILSQRSSTGEKSLPDLLDAHFAEEDNEKEAFVIHRLDKNVGGVMVYAKHHRMASALSELVAEGKITKEYLAVTEGDAAALLGEEGELSDLLFKDSAKGKSFVVKTKRKGVKEAHLFYRVIGRAEREGKVYSLVHVTLGTGRTHQIRVQFASRGLPLVGDGRYGSKGGKAPMLFSFALGFTHPFTCKALRFTLDRPMGTPWDWFD